MCGSLAMAGSHVRSIERKIGTAAWVPIAHLAANTTSFANRGLALNTSYTYRVRAFNAVSRHCVLGPVRQGEPHRRAV